MSSTTMLYVQPQGHGWGPVNTMVRLAEIGRAHV